MATDMNRWMGVGRLTRDAETKTTPSGTTVTGFSIAVGYTYLSNGEKKDQTSFFNCTAWGKTGEAIAQYVKKGHRIGIEGRLQQQTWDDKDGKKRSDVKIIVERFYFLQSKSDSGKESATAQSDAKPESEVPQPDGAENENPFNGDYSIPF